MRRMLLMACAVVSLGAAAWGDEGSGEQIVEVNIGTPAELTAALGIGEPMACRPGLGAQDFVVDAAGRAALEAMGLKTRTVVEDLESWLAAERAQRAAEAVANGGSFHQAYHDYPAIEAYLDTLVAMNPSIASKVVIGTSIQGRNMYALRIASSAPGSKPAVAITAMQHAREWVAGASALWMAEQLIEGYGVDTELTALVDQIEWHIVPVCNPDGYQWTHTDYRLWRKNRRLNQDFTFGVDLNRNWGYEWGGGPSGSSSTTPSSDIYRGPGAFSEVENRNVRDYLQSISTLRGHIDVHSYSQLILGPWGYDDTVIPPREAEMRLVQEDIEQAINSTNGVIYQAGLGVDQLLYTADGVMPDWTFGVLGAQAWTIEVRDTGVFGFELPAAQIIPTATEVFAGIKRLAFWAQQEGTIDVPAPISQASDAEASPVRARIIAMHGDAVAPGGALLWYRFDDGAYSSVVMTDLGGDEFEGMIPAGVCGQSLDYFVEATLAGGGLLRFPADAPSSTLSAEVAVVVTALADNFQTDTGWTAEVIGATSGGWQRGVPVNDPSWAYDPASDGDGSGSCFLTQNTAGNTDVDGGTVRLISPALDLSGGGATIQYLYFLNLTDTSGSDALRVEVSSNGTAGPWALIASHSTSSLSWQQGIVTQSQLDSAGVVMTADMRVRFSANDSDPQTIVEAGVDGFVARRTGECPMVCPGDLSGDLVVDVNDLNELLGAWQTMPTPGTGADISGDGVVDVNDLNVVLGAWGQAC